MRNRGRNYSRTRDRVYPGYSVKTKSGKWKTIHRYKKPWYKRKQRFYKFQPAGAPSTEVFMILAVAGLLLYGLGWLLDLV